MCGEKEVPEEASRCLSCGVVFASEDDPLFD